SGDRRVAGQAHFAWSALRKPGDGGPPADHDVGQALKDGPYADEAIVPRCVPAPGVTPITPEFNMVQPHGSTYGISWHKPKPDDPDPWLWEFWQYEGGWKMSVLPRGQPMYVEVPNTVTQVAVRAVDHYNQE